MAKYITTIINTLREKVLPFITKYKWLLIPGIPLIFISFMLAFLNTGDQPSQESPTVIPTSIQPTTALFPSPTTSAINPFPESGEEGHPDMTEGGQEEILPDGTKQFSFPSGVSSRQDIIIAEGENNNILFQRSVIQPNTVPVSDYTDAYGQPDRIIQGSTYYGTTARTSIYGTRGIAFIWDAQTNYVLELHTFPPMNVTEYIQNYGDDIPANQR